MRYANTATSGPTRRASPATTPIGPWTRWGGSSPRYRPRSPTSSSGSRWSCCGCASTSRRAGNGAGRRAPPSEARNWAIPPRPQQKPFWNRGDSVPRIYRNTLVFLAVDKTRLQDLDEAVRRYLAWESILEEREPLDLSPHQVRQAEIQKEAAASAVTARLPEAYQWLLVPGTDAPRFAGRVAGHAIVGPGSAGGQGEQEAEGRRAAGDRICRHATADGARSRAAVARR